MRTGDTRAFSAPTVPLGSWGAQNSPHRRRGWKRVHPSVAAWRKDSAEFLFILFYDFFSFWEESGLTYRACTRNYPVDGEVSSLLLTPGGFLVESKPHLRGVWEVKHSWSAVCSKWDYWFHHSDNNLTVGKGEREINKASPPFVRFETSPIGVLANRRYGDGRRRDRRAGGLLPLGDGFPSCPVER